MSYSSLHGHSPFSNIHLLDCTSKVSSIFDRAHEIGLYGVAITDHEAISSFVEAEEYLAKKKKENPEDQTWQKMKFLRGNEVYLVRDGLTKDTVQRGEKFHHFILLAKNFKGYSQLCELSSRAWRRSFKYYRTRTPTYYSDLKEVIQESPGNLIGSTACLGSAIGERLLKAFRKEESHEGAIAFVQKWCSRMKEIFGEGNFYLELQPGTSDEQVYVNQQLFSVGKTLEIPCIITTDHHYLTESDRKIHKAYLQSRNEEREVDAFYEATYMMDAETIHKRMRETFKGVGYTEEEISSLVGEMLQNTNKVADMCEDYTLLKPLELPYLPQKEFEAPDLKESVLAELVRAIPTLQLFLDDPEPSNRQFVMRLGAFMLNGDTPEDPPRYLVKEKAQQMAEELQIIWDSGQKLTPSVHWSKYLLQVADYINICWNEGDSILAPSRGSAGASYSCHALGINQMDPTREKAPLFFER